MSTTSKHKPETFVEHFIAAVKEQIELKQLTMSQVARDSEIGRAYLYRVLSGEHQPTMEVAVRIAKAVGLSFKLSGARS